MALIKEHQRYAQKLGLYDQVVDKYDETSATKYIGKKNYYQFLIMDNDKCIGILDYKLEKSEIDNAKILYLKDIYIIDAYRGKGIGKIIIEELNYRIELECWYGMPANLFYKALGFKELKTHNSHNKLQNKLFFFT